MTRLQPLDRDSYYKALAELPDARFHQLWDHEAARTDGCRFEAVRTASGALALVRTKTVVGRGLAYIYGGPAFADVDPTQEQIAQAFVELRDAFAERKLLLRIVPALHPGRASDVQEALEGAGYKRVEGVANYRTILLPLQSDLETLINQK